MSKKRFFSLMILCGIIFVSCATSPKFNGTANLTGLIVDENNNPVKDFPVTVLSGINILGKSMTNESGIFVVQNVPSGKIYFSGKKEGYVILNQSETFYRKDKIVCIQISSVDSVLDRVDRKILQEDYDGGLAELKEIYSKRNSEIHNVVLVYEQFLTQKQKEGVKKNEKK